MEQKPQHIPFAVRRYSARIIDTSKLNVTFVFKFNARAMYNAFNRTYKTEDLFISEIIQFEFHFNGGHICKNSVWYF